MTIRTTLVAAVATLAFALAPLSSAVAQGTLHGAIAFSPSTKAYGFSYDYATKRQAEREAMRFCNQEANDCVIAVTFYNGCGAVAAGRNGWGADWGATSNRAQQNALDMCSNYTTRCRVVRWQCTS
jgi:serine/threonine-protein kinase